MAGDTVKSMSALGRFESIIPCAVLALHASLLAWGAWRHSPTWDEVSLLPAGIRHWESGNFSLCRQNPPLVRTVAAIPVMLAGPETRWLSPDDDLLFRNQFAVAADFVKANGARVFWLFTLARWPCIVFSLIGGWTCFLWARRLYGDSAGLLALALWCFSPDVLAHGQLLTTDMAATALGVATMYLLWRWLEEPRWGRAVAVGLTLGLAELAKMLWIILFGLIPLVWVVWLLTRPRELSKGRLSLQGLQLGLSFLVALSVLNIGYRFEGSFRRLGSYRFDSQLLGGSQGSSPRGNRFASGPLGWLPVPVPENYLKGIDYLRERGVEMSQPSFLHGQWQGSGGWWYYYLYGLAVKVPLGVWCLLVLSFSWRLLRADGLSIWRDELILVIPAVVVLVFMSYHTSLNKHFRYVLPLYPFAFVWISRVARASTSGGRTFLWLGQCALLWSIMSSLWVFPHSLSYFNELVGGPTQGHRYAHGSNVDWGQDLLYLRRWLDKHPEVRSLQFAYAISIVDTSAAGIALIWPPPGIQGATPGQDPSELGPRPGWYAMSVNEIHHHTGKYAYFLKFRPVAMVGYSTFIYHISPDEANRVRQEFGLPPLSDTVKTPA